jgi:hypothetical protein
VTTKRKTRVPKYLAGVSVVQSEKKSVTFVDVEKVLIMVIAILAPAVPLGVGLAAMWSWFICSMFMWSIFAIHNCMSSGNE